MSIEHPTTDLINISVTYFSDGWIICLCCCFFPLEETMCLVYYWKYMFYMSPGCMHVRMQGKALLFYHNTCISKWWHWSRKRVLTWERNMWVSLQVFFKTTTPEGSGQSRERESDWMRVKDKTEGKQTQVKSDKRKHGKKRLVLVWHMSRGWSKLNKFNTVHLWKTNTVERSV